MTRLTTVEHRFVDHIPRQLDPAVIYLSLTYNTAVHSCCCGCGEQVVNPLSPKQWKVTYDGRSISLDPSIGNWSFACQSHYWIEHNDVRWARQWTEKEIATGRGRTERLLTPSQSGAAAPAVSAAVPKRSRWWHRFRR